MFPLTTGLLFHLVLQSEMVSPNYAIMVSIAALIVMGLMNFFLYRSKSREDAIAEGKRIEMLNNLSSDVAGYRIEVKEYQLRTEKMERTISALTGKSNGHTYRFEES